MRHTSLIRATGLRPGRHPSFAPRLRTRRPQPAPFIGVDTDISTITFARSHFQPYCALHEMERLITSVPVLPARPGLRDVGFLRTKAEHFPHSWSAVWSSPFLHTSELLGDPPRLLVLCCPRCREVAAEYLGREPLPETLAA